MICDLVVNETKSGYEVRVNYLNGPVDRQWTSSILLYGPSEFKPTQELVTSLLNALEAGQKLTKWNLEPLFDPLPANEWIRM